MILVRDASVDWNENRSQNSLCNMQTAFVAYLHVTLQLLIASAQNDSMHSTSHTPFPTNCLYDEQIGIPPSSPSPSPSPFDSHWLHHAIFPCHLKRYMHFWRIFVGSGSALAATLTLFEPCRTSFGCHHRQFVVITIETKWHGFKSWMCHTYLVAARV